MPSKMADAVRLAGQAAQERRRGGRRDPAAVVGAGAIELVLRARVDAEAGVELLDCLQAGQAVRAALADREQAHHQVGAAVVADLQDHLDVLRQRLGYTLGHAPPRPERLLARKLALGIGSRSGCRDLDVLLAKRLD